MVQTGPAGSVVEHPLRDREVVSSNPGRAIPKALKWYQWLPCLVLSIIRQALASLLLTKYRTTSLATLAKIKKSEKSPIIINVCIHRRTVWKTGSYAKYVILLKYRDYYYYYYYPSQTAEEQLVNSVMFVALIASFEDTILLIGETV